MGVFSDKEVFPIGISLYRPTRGTRSDGKLNFIYNITNTVNLIVNNNLNKEVLL